MNLVKANMVLGVAAVVLAIPTVLLLRGEAGDFTDLATIPLLFDGFTADNAGVVTVASPKKEQPPPDPANPNKKQPIAYDQVVAQRSDKGWLLAVGGDLAGAPVSAQRLDSDVFAHLLAIRFDRKALVQPNATEEQLKGFGLDEAQAFVIQVKDKTGTVALCELLVGKDASAGQFGTEAVRGVFVRKADSNDVILYEPANGFWRRDVTLDQWLDKSILKLEPDKVKQVVLRNPATPGYELVLDKKPGSTATWTTPMPPAECGALRQQEVENLVQRLRWVNIQEYRRPAQAANLKELGLQPAQIELKVTWTEGDADKMTTLSIGNVVDGKQEHWLLSSDSQFLMTLPSYLVQPLERAAKEFFDPAGPPADDGTVKDGKEDKQDGGGKK